MHAKKELQNCGLQEKFGYLEHTNRMRPSSSRSHHIKCNLELSQTLGGQDKSTQHDPAQKTGAMETNSKGAPLKAPKPLAKALT